LAELCDGGREGAALVEDRGAVFWRRSRYSGSDDLCCEVAMSSDEIRVRDSKQPNGEVLTFTPDAWRAATALFLAGYGTGQAHE
jgi:hypothetical protein